MTTATVGPQPKSFDPAALLAEAMALHQAGRLADAERLYNQILAFDPGQCDCLHLLGVILLQRGKPAQAVAQIDLSLARYRRGTLCRRTGETGVGAAAVHSRLALAARSRRQPLVSEGAAVSAGRHVCVGHCVCTRSRRVVRSKSCADDLVSPCGRGFRQRLEA